MLSIDTHNKPRTPRVPLLFQLPAMCHGAAVYVCAMHHHESYYRPCAMCHVCHQVLAGGHVPCMMWVLVLPSMMSHSCEYTASLSVTSMVGLHHACSTRSAASASACAELWSCPYPLSCRFWLCPFQHSGSHLAKTPLLGQFSKLVQNFVCITFLQFTKVLLKLLCFHMFYRIQDPLWALV